MARSGDQRLLRIKTALQDDRRTEHQSQREVGHPPGMEERRGDQRDAAGSERNHVEQRGRWGKRAGLLALRSLWSAGRAASEDDDPPWRRRRIERIGWLAGAQLVKRPLRRASGAVCPSDHRSPPYAGGGNRFAELLVVDDRNRALLLTDLADLRRGEHCVEEDQISADPVGGDSHLDEITVVAAEHGDPVARPDAGGREPACQRVRPLIELAVAQRASVVNQRCGVRTANRSAGVAASDRSSPATQHVKRLDQQQRILRLDHSCPSKGSRNKSRLVDLRAHSIQPTDGEAPADSRCKVLCDLSEAARTVQLRCRWNQSLQSRPSR